MGDSRKKVRLWAGVTVLGVVAGYVAVLLANSRHFYTDDSESQYVPMWVEIGRHLREGNLPGIVPQGWMAGNYAIEGVAGLYNPPQLLVSFIAPSVDNLIVLATAVKLVYTIILALGIFRICLEYGAKPQWATVAAVAFPFSGWFLFFDEASWVLGLAGTAWITHAWASGIRYARGRGGPIPVFVFMYFVASIGEVSPAIEAGLMLVAIAIGEVVYQRRWWPPLKLLLAGGFACLGGVITYLPGVLSSDVTWRNAEFVVKNDGYLVIPWSESLNASLPTTLPAFHSWFGLVQPFPVVYIAWFVIPGLAFVDWRKAAGALRELSGALMFGVVALMWTAGPAHLGPLRWPVRILPMLALTALIVVCVLLSRYGTVRNLRGRASAAAVLVGLLLVRSIAAAPSNRILIHICGALIVAALVAAVVFIARRWTPVAACLAILVTIPATAFYMVNSVGQHPMSWNLPGDRAAAREVFPKFTGTTLQLGDPLLFPREYKNLDGTYSGLVVGYYAKDLDLDYVNGYTPVGHYWFSRHLCMKWDGGIDRARPDCQDVPTRIFVEKEPTTGLPLIDLMKVDRVTLQRSMYPNAREQTPPPGWHWVDLELPPAKWIWVLERDGGPISARDGLIAHTQGVTATSESESDHTSAARVSSEQGGRVVFARLPWPGYSVTLDGRELPVTSVKDIFLSVDVPAGTRDGELVVRWRPPGWQLGAGSALVGVLGILALQWLYLRRRRERSSPAETTAE